MGGNQFANSQKSQIFLWPFCQVEDYKGERNFFRTWTNFVSEPKPDGELIAAVLAGETGQFDEIVFRYRQVLLRVAYSRMGRTDWAEDVVQETFFCAFKSLHSYNSQFSFRTWLWTILLNQCRRHLKKRSRSLLVRSWSDHCNDIDEIQSQLSDQLRSDDLPSDRLDAKERRQLLDALLGRLPEPQADALRLRYFGGLKFHEIAKAMNCSLSTAKNRVRWGLERMTVFMQSEPQFEVHAQRD